MRSKELFCLPRHKGYGNKSQRGACLGTICMIQLTAWWCPWACLEWSGNYAGDGGSFFPPELQLPLYTCFYRLTPCNHERITLNHALFKKAPLLVLTLCDAFFGFCLNIIHDACTFYRCLELDAMYTVKLHD